MCWGDGRDSEQRAGKTDVDEGARCVHRGVGAPADACTSSAPRILIYVSSEHRMESSSSLRRPAEKRASVTVRITAQLVVWADGDGTGVAFDSSTGFILRN